MNAPTITRNARRVDFRIPAGTLVIGADAMAADRDAWLNARRSGVTATDMRVLAGQGYADETVYDRWLDKLDPERAHEEPGSDTNVMLELGNLIEPVIETFAERHFGVEMRRVGMVRSRHVPFMLASPDRNTSDGGGAELKNTSSHYLRHYRNAEAALTNRDGWTLPPAWWVQALHQLTVTGWSHVYIAALIGDTRRMTYWTVEPDRHQQDIQDVLAEMFWQHVTDGTAPEVEWDTITEAEVKARWPRATTESVTPANVAEVQRWVARYTDLTATIGPLEKEKKALATLLQATAGAASDVLDADGRVLYQYVNRSRKGVDVERLAADAGLNVDDYRTAAPYRALAGFPKGAQA